jgi:5-methylcytosine-specific restriction endonuclease McrA
MRKRLPAGYWIPEEVAIRAKALAERKCAICGFDLDRLRDPDLPYCWWDRDPSIPYTFVPSPPIYVDTLERPPPYTDAESDRPGIATTTCRTVYTYRYFRSWTITREIVDLRDPRRCRACGFEFGWDPPADRRLEYDHIVPISENGDPLDPSNVQILCRACHAKKTASEARARIARMVRSPSCPRVDLASQI